MRDTRLALLFGIILLFVAVPLSATSTPVPLFNQCPQVGEALGCSYLPVFGARASVNLLFDPGAKNMDGQENILVGIQNNLGHYVGITGYNDPNNAFSGLHLTDELGDSKSIHIVREDSSGQDNETEDVDVGEEDDPGKGVTPEPSSMALLGTGLLALGGILRRRLRP